MDTTEGVFSEKNKTAIEGFIENGGSLLAIHGSISVGRDWPWYQQAIGTSFRDHPNMQDAEVSSRSGDLRWKQFDEWYNFTNHLGPAFTILFKISEKTYLGGTMGDFHPIVWWRNMGKGRVWYTAMGHSLSLYEDSNSEFMKLLVSTTIWSQQQSGLLIIRDDYSRKNKI